MRLPTLFVSTAVLAAVTVSVASAQTPAPKTSKDTTPPAPSPSRSSYAEKKTSRSNLPAPPTVPLRPSRRGATASRAAAGSGMIGIDQTGRRDQAGRKVRFYATVRGKVPVGPRASAMKDAPTPTPPQNPQKEPYKRPGGR